MFVLTHVQYNGKELRNISNSSLTEKYLRFYMHLGCMNTQQIMADGTPMYMNWLDVQVSVLDLADKVTETYSIVDFIFILMKNIKLRDKIWGVDFGLISTGTQDSESYYFSFISLSMQDAKRFLQYRILGYNIDMSCNLLKMPFCSSDILKIPDGIRTLSQSFLHSLGVFKCRTLVLPDSLMPLSYIDVCKINITRKYAFNEDSTTYLRVIECKNINVLSSVTVGCIDFKLVLREDIQYNDYCGVFRALFAGETPIKGKVTVVTPSIAYIYDRENNTIEKCSVNRS